MRFRDLTDDGDSSDDSYGTKKKGKKAIRKKKRIVSDSESSDEEDERKRKKSKKVRSVMESDSDSEDERKTKKKVRKDREETEEDDSSDEEAKRSRRKAVRKRKDRLKDEEDARKEVQSKSVDVDIDKIVWRIQGLKVDDSEYAVCYFKLLEAKPTVAQLLLSPFQHMCNVLVQQAATYPNSIPISGQRSRSFCCHFCAMPGCRIGTCEIVNKYITAGSVVHDGRMVLYVDKGQIPWCLQGLKISVDSRFEGPLVAPGTSDNVPDTS